MKRALALILCLLLLPAAMATAETYLIGYTNSDNYDSTDLLIRDDGTVLVEPFVYDGISRLTPEDWPEDRQRYSAMRILPLERAYTEEELWELDDAEYIRTALLDGSGRPLTGFDYYYLSWDEAGGQIIFQLPDQRVGAMDADGNVLLPADYYGVYPNGEGGWLVLDRDGQTRRTYDHYYPIHYVDAQGNERDTGFTAQFGGIQGYSDGLCAVNWVPRFDDRAIYLDSEGRWAFEGAYDFVLEFHDGIAGADPDGEGYCLIDDAGNLLTEGYDNLHYQEYDGDAVYVASDYGRLAIFDARTGECRRAVEYPGEETWVYGYRLGPGLIGVYVSGQDDCCEVYDLSGTLLFSVGGSYNLSGYYTADEMPARLIFAQGEWPDVYGRMVDLSDAGHGPYYSQVNGELWRDGEARAVVIDYVIVREEGSDDYDYIDWDHSFYGVCDGEGEEVLPAVYTSVEVLDLDRYWVRTGTRAGLIDGAGNWLYTINDYQFLMD